MNDQSSDSQNSVETGTVEFSDPVITIGGRLSHRQYLKEAFRNPDFVFRYPIAELRAKHRETLLGVAWEVITPLLLVLTWWIIRGVVFPRNGGSEYLSFLIVGIFAYQYVQRLMVSGANAIDRTQAMMLTFNFPALVGPLQHAVSALVSNLPNVLVMLVFVTISGISPTWTWLLIVPLVVGQSVLALGGSLALARFSSGNLDLKNALPFIFRLTFYASGVIFSLEDRIRGKAIAWLFDLNPFYAIVALSRWVVTGTDIATPTIFSALGWMFLLPVAGYLTFRTGDDRYVE